MIGALWTGISGLSGQQTAIDNESHNIANVNTVGYKASRISFADQMYQDKIGKGTKILDAEKLYTQGSTKLTGVSYDMALSGDGFFAVKNNRASGTSETLYTRAGNFRMGDNGTLQDANGYEVQGWAMSPLTEDSITSTNYNVNMFTSDYNKLVTSKVINHGTYVETVTAKTTDYNTTAKADGTAVFGGSGAKNKASKVSDVEELVKSYTNWLQKLKETPDGKSSNSVAQVTQINFEGTELKGESDQIYVFLDGEKIEQDFIATTASGTFKTTAEQEAANLKASQIATYKALADKISNKTGFVAYNVIDSLPTDKFEASDTFKASTKDEDVIKGMIEIRAMIPGKEFSISEVAETSGGTTVFGKVNETSSATKAVVGTGQGAVDSAKEALKNAVVGKQRDVYMPGVGGELEGLGMYDLNFQVTLYDKELKKNVIVPAAPLTMSSLTIKTVDEVVNAINTHTDLGKYVRAENINGNLVVETLDKNSDIEFSSSLKGPVLTQEGSLSQTTAANPTTKEKEILTNVSIDGTKSYQLEIAVNGGGTQTVRVDNPADINALVASLNGNPSSFNSTVNETTAPGPLNTSNVTLDATKVGAIGIGDTFTFNLNGTTLTTPALVAGSMADLVAKINDSIATDGTYAGKVEALVDGTNTIKFKGTTNTQNVNVTGFNEVTTPYTAAIAGTAGTIPYPAGSVVHGSTITMGGNTYATTDRYQLTIDGTTINTTSDLAGTATSDVVDKLNETISANPTLSGKYKAEVNGANIVIKSTNPLGTDFAVSAFSRTTGGAFSPIATFANTDTNLPANGSLESRVATLPTPAPTFAAADEFSVTIAGTTVTTNALGATPTLNDVVTALNVAINADGTIGGKYVAEIDGTNIKFRAVDDGATPIGDLAFQRTTGGNFKAPLSGVANADASTEVSEIVPAVTPTFSADTVHQFSINVAGAGKQVVAVTGATDMTDLASKIDASLKALTPAPAVTVTESGGKLVITAKNPNEDITDLGFTDGSFDIVDGVTASTDVSGNLILTADNVNQPLTNIIFKEIDTVGVIDKNADYSGREGAGAEFLEIVNTIDQTASQGSLQLKLDALGISDSAFGEFSVDKSGLITMKQDGAEFAIGQVSVALFNNQRGLEPYGDNLLAKTNNSGDPIYNTNNERTANIQGKSLELSTADLSKSLVNLMVFQRAFEANAKSITTSDSLLNTLINLKR